jgi:Ankyrin repeat
MVRRRLVSARGVSYAPWITRLNATLAMTYLLAQRRTMQSGIDCAGKTMLALAAALCAMTVSCDPRPANQRRLCEALQTGDTNYLQRYLAAGGDVNQSIQYTPSKREAVPLLDVAVLYGQLEAVEFLLDKGADPNRRDSVGVSPLG